MNDEGEFTVAELAARIVLTQLDFVATLSDEPFDPASDFVCGYAVGMFDALVDEASFREASAPSGDLVAIFMPNFGRDRGWVEAAMERGTPDFDEGERTGAADAAEWLQNPRRAPRGLVLHLTTAGRGDLTH